MICVLLPLKLCSLPLKIFSHFLTGMAREARTGQTLSQPCTIDISSICEDSALICPWMYANWSEVCCTWDSSMPYICFTRAMRWSRQSGPHAYAWEDGCAELSGAEVNLSISSSVSPPSFSTLSLGIWETPILGPVMWALLLVTVLASMG